MYAVIKTGGKQYRVQAGDVLVVEKLEGEPGAEVSFGDVLMLGDGEAVTLGAPLVDGATVSATLIETRRGEKIKIFKKIRRQGYRRTQGHRQSETVLRVTAIAGAGKTDKWDGTVDLTPKALLDARARNLTGVVAALEAARAGAVTTEAPQAKAAPKAKAPAKAKAEAVAASPEVAEAAAVVQEAAPAKKAAPKKAAAKKSDAE
jgi:large subunit ribosomal protein L21